MKFVPIRTQTGATPNPDYAAPTGATANLIAPNLIAFGRSLRWYANMGPPVSWTRQLVAAPGSRCHPSIRGGAAKLMTPGIRRH